MNEDMVNVPITTAPIEKKSQSLPSECKICGTPALYQYYGTVVCQSCKIFFRRNAKKTFKCDYGGNCEININNRHVCTSCRLAKCFANRMQVELIRCARSKKTAKSLSTPQSTNKVTTNEQKQLQLIPVLNLLRSDQSDLSINQWNLISNLIHCYEEHSLLSYVQEFIEKQTSLPIKLRFKVASISELFGTILSGVELFFKSNNDFLSLCSHDRSILLRCAMENAGSFGAVLVLRQTKLFDHPGITESVETVYGSTVSNLTLRLLDEVDRDITFVKLGIAMFAFSTNNCASYTNVGLGYLKNIKDILRIQDMYAEVAWKYLLYRYDHQQAVKCFINFIQCLFIVNTAIIATHEELNHKRMFENLIEKIDQQVTVTG